MSTSINRRINCAKCGEPGTDQHPVDYFHGQLLHQECRPTAQLRITEVSQPQVRVTELTIRGAVARGWRAKVFDGDLAEAISQEVYALILADKTPNLGCATTRELINELRARCDNANMNGEDWPLYRTVDEPLPNRPLRNYIGQQPQAPRQLSDALDQVPTQEELREKNG